MAVNPLNVLVGPCKIFQVDGADMGATTGGVTVGLAHTAKEIQADQVIGPIAYAISNRVIEVKTKLMEVTLLHLQVSWNLTSPPALDGAGNLVLGLGIETIQIDHIVRFVGRAPNNKEREVILNRATMIASAPVPFMKDSEQMFDVTFAALPDFNKPQGQQLGTIKDLISAY